MKPLFGIMALVLSGMASAQLPCDASTVMHSASRLDRIAFGFSQAVTNSAGYTHLSREANLVYEGANQLAGLASTSASCLALGGQFRHLVTPAFERLSYSQRLAQQSYPNGYLASYFRDVETHYYELSRVLNVISPPPPPPPIGGADTCYGLGGYYQGLCRANTGGGVSSVSFYVGNVNGRCTAYNSGYFQPASLRVVQGYATGNVAAIPGGVAISSSTLTVYGAGRFSLSGYNYAGNFYFTCSQ